MEVKTILLQGKKYAPVKERLKAFRETFTTGKIVTSYDFKEWFAIFKAEIFPKLDELNTMATWHSFWKTNWTKSFEKLETIAVGRALWIAWFGADWDIASFDEMQDYMEKEKIVEKAVFRKQEFKQLTEALNDWGIEFANAWIEDNKDVFYIWEELREQITELYQVFKENSKITKEDIDKIWTNAEKVAEQAKWIS